MCRLTIRSLANFIYQTMDNLAEIEEKIQHLKPFLVNEYNVRNIGVFGSYSRSEQSETSDIDILIDLGEPLGWKFFELKEYLESQLNRPVDLVTRKALKRQLKQKILSQTKFI